MSSVSRGRTDLTSPAAADEGRASSTRRVVVATRNAGKLAEIRHALAFTGWEFFSVGEAGTWPEPEECGVTFEENARIKATDARAHTSLAALADDSGLEVDALGGAPGVVSSRYSGDGATDELNIARLLGELANVADERRTARFRCVIVYIDEHDVETVAEGTCEGRVGREPRGEGGFGYDPIFEPLATPGRTMAELETSEKDAISHRGAALRALRDALEHRGSRIG